MQSYHLPPLPMKNWFSLLNMSYSNMINLETRSDAHTHNPHWRISAGASNSKISLRYSVQDSLGYSVGILPQTHSNNNKVEKKMI